MEPSVFTAYPYTAAFLKKPTAIAKHLILEEGGGTVLFQDSAGRWLSEQVDQPWLECFRPGTVRLAEALDNCSREELQILQQYLTLQNALPAGLDYIGQHPKGHLLFAQDTGRFLLVPEELYPFLSAATAAGLSRREGVNSVLDPALLVIRSDGTVEHETPAGRAGAEGDFYTPERLHAAVQKEIQSFREQPAQFAKQIQTRAFLQLGFENAVAVWLQAPRASRVFPVEELAPLGIVPQEGQRPVLLLVPMVQEFFWRGGKRLPLREAEPEEQRAILQGKLSTEREVLLGLSRGYDVSQLDCSLGQKQALLREKRISFQELWDFAEQVRSPGGRSLQVEERQLPAIPSVGFFERETNTIVLREGLPLEQKIAALAEQLAGVLVEQTSASPKGCHPLEKEMLSTVLLSMAGIPPDELRQQGLEAALTRYRASFPAPALEELAAKTVRAALYVRQGLDVLRQRQVQAAEPGLSFGQEEQLANFLQGL